MRGRKLSASRESRRLITEARRERQRARDAREREHDARTAAMHAALARRPESSAQVVDRLLAGAPHNQPLRQLLGIVGERAPRLLDAGMLRALQLVAEAAWVRPPATWQPQGKSEDSLFCGLADHVLARYRVPPFVWSAFADEDAPILARVVTHVAAGGSLYQAVRSGLMPVPLTRAMCHALLSSPGEARFLDVVRKVQVKAAGGDSRLFRAWIATRAGRRLHAQDDEAFWQTVLAWFCANPVLPLAQVAPLVDYLSHRRTETPGFCMKGRSAPALLRGMVDWHRQLGRTEVGLDRVFKPSGLQPMDIDRSRPARWGNPGVLEVWYVREVLDARTLADEGRAMGHCVYSYGRAIDEGQCAIWTLTLRNDTGHWRRLTIEVRLSTRQIVQARGRFNAKAEPRDVLVLEAWATRNKLTASLGRW